MKLCIDIIKIIIKYSPFCTNCHFMTFNYNTVSKLCLSCHNAYIDYYFSLIK